MTSQLKILDCTLRDGGYYNNWDFDGEIVRDYLSALAEAKIDYIELGLRNFPKSTFDGPLLIPKNHI
jgi:4-hydroxy 2-oxovalerate aldolase